jgi:HK97 family phage prohead protease
MMEKQNKEVRMFTGALECREDTERQKNTIVGVPIVFEQKTDLGMWEEVIEKGALDQTDLKDVRLLVNHDTNQLPLARSRNNNANSTMQLTVEDDGLHIRADLDVENNPRAAEVLSAVEREDVTGMSFMFTVDKDSWENLESEYPTRHILSIGKVFEASVVTFPAYEQTSVYARSLENVQSELESERKALESARKTEELRKALNERSANLCRKD